jgi:hypothetical protein
MNFSNEKRYVKLLQQVQTLTMLQDSAHILGFARPDATSRKVLNLASHQIKVERAQRSLLRIEKEVLKLNTRWQPGDESYDQAAVLVAQDRAADLKMDIQRCASWFAAICSSHPLPHHYRLFQSHLRFAKQGKNYDASASKPKISHASASSRRSKAADRKAVLKQHHVTSACCTRAHLSPCVWCQKTKNVAQMHSFVTRLNSALKDGNIAEDPYDAQSILLLGPPWESRAGNGKDADSFNKHAGGQWWLMVVSDAELLMGVVGGG